MKFKIKCPICGTEFEGSTFDDCPYFRLDDEYGLVRKQN